MFQLNKLKTLKLTIFLSVLFSYVGNTFAYEDTGFSIIGKFFSSISTIFSPSYSSILDGISVIMLLFGTYALFYQLLIKIKVSKGENLFKEKKIAQVISMMISFFSTVGIVLMIGNQSIAEYLGNLTLAIILMIIAIVIYVILFAEIVERYKEKKGSLISILTGMIFIMINSGLLGIYGQEENIPSFFLLLYQNVFIFGSIIFLIGIIWFFFSGSKITTGIKKLNTYISNEQKDLIDIEDNLKVLFNQINQILNIIKRNLDGENGNNLITLKIALNKFSTISNKLDNMTTEKYWYKANAYSIANSFKKLGKAVKSNKILINNHIKNILSIIKGKTQITQNEFSIIVENWTEISNILKSDIGKVEKTMEFDADLIIYARKMEDDLFKQIDNFQRDIPEFKDELKKYIDERVRVHLNREEKFELKKLYSVVMSILITLLKSTNFGYEYKQIKGSKIKNIIDSIMNSITNNNITDKEIQVIVENTLEKNNKS